MSAQALARGVLHVHSAPPALCPHVEWAVAGVLGMPISLDWAPQPASAGALRAECSWRAAPGTAGRIAAAMRGWSLVRFEVTEEPSPGSDGERYAYTPGLGLFRATMSANGDVLVAEGPLRSLIAASGDVAGGVRRLLGTEWDAELDVFRCAGDGAPVRWLPDVG